MYILGIESSCDETAAAVVKYTKEVDEIVVLSNIIATQIELHKKYGGVVPEVASRLHIESISAVVNEALSQAKVALEDLDGVAVTYAPGLIGALLVGVNFAKSLAYKLGIPLIPVHHIEGHIMANKIENQHMKFPFVCLVASGGHCTISKVVSEREFETLAKTRDDAPGEAFDKVARILGLGYPGGPAISKIAVSGDDRAFKFTKPKLDTNDFSFSGIKTGVINVVHQLEQKNMEIPVADIAASFQKTVVEILCDRLFQLAKENNVRTIALAGGVASNKLLRETVEKQAEAEGYTFYVPKPIFCTDNAVMIGVRGCYSIDEGMQNLDLNAVAVRPLGTV